MSNIELTCRDCRAPFEFTEGEQEFFNAKGFTPPVRCGECRAKKKAEKMAKEREAQYRA